MVVYVEIFSNIHAPNFRNFFFFTMISTLILFRVSARARRLVLFQCNKYYVINVKDYDVFGHIPSNVYPCMFTCLNCSLPSVLM